MGIGPTAYCVELESMPRVTCPDRVDTLPKPWNPCTVLDRVTSDAQRLAARMPIVARMHAPLRSYAAAYDSSGLAHSEAISDLLLQGRCTTAQNPKSQPAWQRWSRVYVQSLA